MHTTRTWYSVPEICDELGISLSKGWQLVWNGELSSYKVAGRRLVSARDLERFIEAGKTVDERKKVAR